MTLHPKLRTFDDVVRTLSHLGQQLETAHSAETRFREVVNVARTLTRSTQATLRLVDPEAQTLLVVARSGAPMHEGGGADFRVGEGLLGWCVKRHESARLDPVKPDARYRRMLGQAWTPSGLLAAPLSGDGQVVAVLGAARRAGPAYAVEGLRVLELVAAFAAPHLEISRLRGLAESDALTLLFNRHYLSKRAPLEIEIADRTGRPLSVAMIDLDHFGEVNKKCGYEAGDGVLVEAAARMRDCCRAEDVLVRLGGDEFLLLLPDTGLDKAVQVVERLVEALRAVPFHAHGLTLTGSAGVSAVQPTDDAAALQVRADPALLEAKRMGGNRVVRADSNGAG